MRNSLIYFLVLFSSVVSAQQISPDKDSLHIYASDSLFITNTGTNLLTIDSLYTVNPLYGYWMDINTQDSSFIYYASWGGYPGWQPLGLSLEPGHSAKFVFNSVDLCVICKQNSTADYFQDTLVFVSNSLQNDTLLIFVDGEGYTSSVSPEEGEQETMYVLKQNFPNPFNPDTRIFYGLSYDGMVKIRVCDITGREVRTLVNEYKLGGYYEVRFDGTDLPSGVYVYRMETGNAVLVRKMILLK